MLHDALLNLAIFTDSTFSPIVRLRPCIATDLLSLNRQDDTMAEWDKLEETNKSNKGKPAVTDMPPRGSNPTEAWRKIDVKVKKTILHRLFIWLVFIGDI